MILSGILEFFLGNTFPSVVFLTFGAFWLTFAGTLNPGFAAFASFAADGQDASTGLQSSEFNASFGASHNVVLQALQTALLHDPAYDVDD